MKALKTGLSGVAIAIFAFPSVATAAYLVPPGNSAVNQYTESVPTAGGHKDIDKGSGRKPSPAKVLGAGNARRLEEQGPQGREAAEVAAETAPITSVTSSPANPTPPTDDDEAGGAGAPGGGGGGGHSGSGPSDRPAGTGHPTSNGGGALPSAAAADVSGSSGLGEVLSQATGSSSSGQMGLLLPLMLLAALAWGVAFLWKQRNRPTT